MIMTIQPTELTTSATDALLAFEAVMMAVYLWRTASGDRWRTGLWCWVFGLIAFSSFLGAIVHGFELPNSMRAALWMPLILTLEILAALFLVGAVYDWRGRAVAGRLIPWSIGVGVAIFALTAFLLGGFIVFAVYAAAATLIALTIYSFLAATRRLKGAGVVSLAILCNLAAAGVQASDVSLRIVFPFDHNGICHLIQMVATGALGLGLRLGMQPGTK